MQDVSILSLVGRLIFSLAVVLFVMVVVARALRKRTGLGIGGGSTRRDLLRILARQPLSRTASVAIVRAADRAFVVGVTDQRVDVLSELDPATLESDDALAPVVTGPSWSAFMDALRERSVRKS